MTEGTSTVTRIRWRWVALCSGLGAVFWGGAFFVEARFGWSGAFPDWMLHVGTAIGLAGMLFLLEQRFSQTVTAATGQLVQEAESRFESRAQALTARLDQLGEQFRAGLDARATAQDAVLQVLDDDVSFDTVTAALEAANDIGALADGFATVQGSVDPDELAVEFRWFTTSWPPRREGGFAPELTLAAQVEADFYIDGARPVMQVTWAPGQSAIDVGLALAGQLQQRGRWKSPGSLDWEQTIRNLRHTLDVAIRSQRRDSGAWYLGGPLIELIGNDWALSAAGIEHRDHGLVLAKSEFPDRPSRFGGTPAEWNPEKPDWTDPAEWARLIRHGKRNYPWYRGPARSASMTRPMTTALRNAGQFQ